MVRGRESLPDEMGRYIAGTFLSSVGTATFRSIVPILAVTTLSVGADAVGVLNALSMIGMTLLGIPIGVFADRFSTRRMMIFADLARALLLLLVAVLGISGRLSIVVLGIVCVCVGIAEVFFTTANSARVPSLVEDRQLPLAFGRLKAASTTGEVASPGVAAVMLGVVVAPAVAAVAAVAYLGSAALFAKPTGKLGNKQASRRSRRTLFSEALEGLRYSLGNPVLRALLLSGMAASTGAMFMNAFNVVYLANVVGLSTALIALVTTVQGVGGLVGALVAPRLIARRGEATTKIAASAAAALPCLGYFAAPSLGADGIWAIVIACAGGGFVAVIAGVAGASVPARVAPRAMLGRVIACNRTFALGIMPFASIAGGLVVSQWGYEVGLISVILFALASSLLLALSPFRRWTSVRPGREGDEDE
ncbi:MFS transporter [Microbacterium gorillae]|uniref:MFS transporter n=1 Tax=Microbacterium gorillae TaxID=1231063 RepID=UPI003D95C767